MDILNSLKLNLQNALKALGKDIPLEDIVIEHSKD